MTEKSEIENYREQVLQALLQLKKEDESDEEVIKLLDTFSDEELAFGMPFNTPDEMARMLLE
ncbi:MAG: hypothetical protein PUG09_11305 [Prevotella sp.]|nr:hypothetical protein [Prevotella sp.]